MAVRATVEALLRERKLDRTLTSAIPERLGEDAVSPLDVEALDLALAGLTGPQRGLAGGLPRGHVSEVVGPASSGRTGLVWAALAAATRRGETVALIDTFDRFDPPTAAACGIVLPRLLWVRGQAVSKTAVAIDPAWLPGVRAVNGPGTFVERVIDRAIKSLHLVPHRARHRRQRHGRRYSRGPAGGSQFRRPIDRDGQRHPAGDVDR